MDISRASNFERFVFDALGRDADRVSELFGEKVKTGGFDLSADDVFPTLADRYGFMSGKSTHADRVQTIRDCSEKNGALIDPHTADGVKVARDVRNQVDTPIVCLETALPVKFAETINEAIGKDPEIPARFAEIMDADRFVVDMPNDAEAVKKYIAENATE